MSLADFGKDDLVPGTIEHPKYWGIYDERDDCWIGNASGPLTYGHRTVAQIAAQMLGTQVGRGQAAFRPRPYSTATIKKDDIAADMTPEQALQNIEDGLSL